MDSLIEGALTHLDDAHVQTRRDFMTICVVDEEHFKDRRRYAPNQECMAKILRVVETLNDARRVEYFLKHGRKSRPPQAFALELAYDALESLMYNTFKYNAIQNAINELVRKNYLLREEQNGAAPLLWLNVDVVQAALNQAQKARNLEQESVENKGVEKHEGGVEKHRGGVEKHTNNIVSNKAPNKNVITSHDLSDGARLFYETWCEVWGGILIDITPGVERACEKMKDKAEQINVDTIKKVVKYAQKTDARYLESGVKIWFFPNLYGQWLTTQQIASTTSDAPASTDLAAKARERKSRTQKAS